MTWRTRVFRTISRTFIFLYARLPIFGALRGAIAVVPSGEEYLMVERADGLGLCFPGGLVHPWETTDSALRRELTEETGLSVKTIQPWFDYRDAQLYPTHISVFRAEAAGDVRSSWEGQVVIVGLPEMESRIIINQRKVVSRLQDERRT